MFCCMFRYFLQDKDPTSGVFYGRHFKPYVKNGYMSGGAGYVLSKEALKVTNSLVKVSPKKFLNERFVFAI